MLQFRQMYIYSRRLTVWYINLNIYETSNKGYFDVLELPGNFYKH